MSEPAVAPGLGSAVDTRDVHRTFGDRHVLRGIDLDIRPGEFVALLGRSGSGKSTLLRALAGLDRDVVGTVQVPARRAVVFQDARLLPWASVLDNVTLGLQGQKGPEHRPGEGAAARPRWTGSRSSRGSGPDADAQGRRALDEVGLAGHEEDWPKTLSGGESQRAALARALVREPELLLLDEPFGALDALTRVRMHVLVQELCARHRPAVLLVTHDVDEAVLLADRVLVLTDGVISLDEPVAMDHPRPRGDARFLALRTRLLAELGIDETPVAVATPDDLLSPTPTLHLEGDVSVAPHPTISKDQP